MKNSIEIVINALQEVVSNPAHDEDKIKTYFSSVYQQIVDGHKLEYADFLSHMKTLKLVTSQIIINIKSVAAEGDTVFTHHFVEVKKSQDGNSQFEVFACFTLSSGKIIRCEELTRMLSGHPVDRDLASRIEAPLPARLHQSKTV